MGTVYVHQQKQQNIVQMPETSSHIRFNSQQVAAPENSGKNTLLLEHVAFRKWRGVCINSAYISTNSCCHEHILGGDNFGEV